MSSILCRYPICLLCVSGLSARWVNHRWARDAGGHRGRRHGGLGQGLQTHAHTHTHIHTHVFVYCVYLILNVCWPTVVDVCFRLVIRRDKWATSQKNTYSFQRPTVSWACYSLWQHLTLVHTRHPTRPSLSCTPTASTVTRPVSAQ